MILTDKPCRGYRTLRLLLTESDYLSFMSDRLFAKNIIDQIQDDCPEVFPANFE